MINNITIATVNFNTPEYIYALSHSIAKFIPNYTNPLIVADNSTVNPLPPGRYAKNNDMCEMGIIRVDNSIYDDINKLPPSKYPAAGSYNSARHAKTINWLLEKIKTPYVFLVDSDVVIVQNFEPIVNQFITSNAILMGYKRTSYKHPCIAPWACFMNLKEIQAHHIHFYDETRMLYINDNLDYDTGASLYEDVTNLGLEIIETPDNTFYRHFKGGSVFKELGLKWLDENEHLWF